MEGTPFGRYRLIEMIGAGGMGEVWRACDTAANNREVAIKLLPVNLANDGMFVARFRREADAAAALKNPHIIPIHNYGEIDGRLYVDMRLVEGRDLQEVLAEGPLEPARAVRIVEQVAKALRAAHRIGLVHRDVKPSNILLDEDDFAYLIDFGIARGADHTRMTGTGAMIGSFHYMAPERLRAQEADARADIYALACVLYECLTASPPFPGGTMESQIAAHLTESPPQPSMTQPSVPAQFDAVIAKGMAKDPDHRYASTVELAKAAGDALTVPLPRPAPDPTPDPPTEPTAPIAAPRVPDDSPPPPPPGAAGSAATEHRRVPHLPAYLAEPGSAATEHADWTTRPQTPPAPAGPTLPPQPATPTARGRRLSRRLTIALIAGAVALVGVLVAAVGIPALSRHGPPQSGPTSAASPTSSARSYAAQMELPFTGLDHPNGVAVDAAGTLYVTDSLNNRVLKLPAGSSSQQELPFTGLFYPDGVAVDGAGTLYVTDSLNNRVLKLPAGLASQEALPFTGLDHPDGVAVDTAGNLYVTDSNNNRVLKLPAGSSSQEALPFTGLNTPSGVAVDTAGNLYVADTYNMRVLKLPAGASTPTELPFTGLSYPWGVAVDGAGTVYVTDEGNNPVLKLPAGSHSQEVLPFTGLKGPGGVAVDAAGNVYGADYNKNRVLKLPAQ